MRSKSSSRHCHGPGVPSRFAGLSLKWFCSRLPFRSAAKIPSPRVWPRGRFMFDAAPRKNADFPAPLLRPPPRTEAPSGIAGGRWKRGQTMRNAHPLGCLTGALNDSRNYRKACITSTFIFRVISANSSRIQGTCARRRKNCGACAAIPPRTAGGQQDERHRRHGPGDRGAARTAERAERGEPSDQREPGSADRARGGGRERLRADRGALRGHGHHRRDGTGGGLRDLGLHRGGASGDRGAVRRAEAVRALPGPGRAAAHRGCAHVHTRARLFARAAAVGHVSGHADAPPGPARGELLPGGEGRRRCVHARGRGAAGALRLPGGDRDRQCPHAPRRAARPRGSGGRGGDLPGRRGRVRRAQRIGRVSEPGGGADRERAVRTGPDAGSVAGHGHLPARRRARDRAAAAPAGRCAERRRNGAGRGDGVVDTGGRGRA